MKNVTLVQLIHIDFSLNALIIVLINTKLHYLYSSPSIIRVIKSRKISWVEHVSRMGEKKNACRILVGKPEGKRPLGRPRRR
jgi:hypothetical protein